MKEESKYDYRHWPEMDVNVHTRTPDPENRLLHGKMLLNPQAGRITFVQSEQRGQRSVEVFRTRHCRLRRRPDGSYGASFIFEAGEKYLMSTLIAELRMHVAASEDDRQRHTVINQ